MEQQAERKIEITLPCGCIVGKCTDADCTCDKKWFTQKCDEHEYAPQWKQTLVLRSA